MDSVLLVIEVYVGVWSAGAEGGGGLGEINMACEGAGVGLELLIIRYFMI